MGNAGTKLKEGFQWLGTKLGEGWEHVKAFGKKAWDKVKSVPVIGKIAEGIEKYTPIGWAADAAIRGINTGVGATSKLLQGDLKGSVGAVTSGIREQLNKENPLLTEIKKVPVLGQVARAGEFVASRVPIFAGMSANDIRNIGNASLNAVDALKEGDFKGAGKAALQAGTTYLSSKSGGLGAVGKAANLAQSL